MPSKHTKSSLQLLVPRITLLVILDILVINLTAFLALLIRYEFAFSTLQESGFLDVAARWAIPNTLLILGLFSLMRLYNSLWGFAGADELLHIFFAVIAAAVVHTIFIYTNIVPLPRTFPPAVRHASVCGDDTGSFLLSLCPKT